MRGLYEFWSGLFRITKVSTSYWERHSFFNCLDKMPSAGPRRCRRYDLLEARANQTLQMSSGTTVSYSVFGCDEDLSSPVVLFIGGTGSHRLSPLPMDALAHQHNVRIITVDRPGTGKTTRFDSAVPTERLAHFQGMMYCHCNPPDLYHSN